MAMNTVTISQRYNSLNKSAADDLEHIFKKKKFLYNWMDNL